LIEAQGMNERKNSIHGFMCNNPKKEITNMRKYLSSLVLVSVVLGGASLALAAGFPPLIADIPHAFLIAGNELPAGQYEFRANPSNSEVVFIRNLGTGKETVALSESRLAARQDGQYSVVFDVIGNQDYLSEIHLGDMDGFYFKAATGKHTHTAVKAKRKS
jgi:hypothetical protein